MANTSPTWPVSELPQVPPMPDYASTDRAMWVELRRYHLSIAAVIARFLGLKPKLMCPYCGGTFRHEHGARED